MQEAFLQSQLGGSEGLTNGNRPESDRDLHDQPQHGAMLERAIEIAISAHRGQRDKAGAPYVLHPLRVMLLMTSQVEMTVAVLHDVVEDTRWTLDDLRREGFSEEVLNALDFLTHRAGEPYEEFIKRVQRNALALQIKLADIQDNLDIRRLNKLAEEDLQRLERYHRAWLTLGQTEGI